MNRRNFIKVSGTAAGGLLLSMVLPTGNLLANELEGNLEPSIFLKINKQGEVTFVLTKLEMGQGSSTGLAQIVADELGANWETLKVETAVYDKKFGDTQHGGLQGVTGGSRTISVMWTPLREAGATAREMLLEAAAIICKDKKEHFYTEGGYAIHKTNGKKLPFKDLVATAAKLPIPEAKSIQLKDPKDFKLIGKTVTHRNTADVVTGKAAYGINIKLPGMYYAAIARCPVYEGKLKSFDATEAEKIKGVKEVFAIKNVLAKNKDLGHIQEGVVVIADSTWTAFKAKKALKIQWDFQGKDTRSVETLRNQIKAQYQNEQKPEFQKGDVKQAFDEADSKLEVVYENPYQAHALMEPLNAVAHYQGNKCEVWIAHQQIKAVTEETAWVTGLPLEAVTVHLLPAGGSFGRRFHNDFVLETAFISKKINAPVKLTWTREDEIQHDAFHPFQHSVYKASIKDEKLTGWQMKAIHTDHWKSGAGTWQYDSIYQVANVLTQNVPLDTIVETGAWRSVGEHINSFGRESFVDEIAHFLKRDPLEYRLELLDYQLQKITDKRETPYYKYVTQLQSFYVQTLKKAKTLASWGKKMPKGSGQGVAVINFGSTVCTQIAEVTVQEGELSVDKITCVVYCGTVVNPHFVKGQIEGGIVWALSALKYGGVNIENGIVQQDNFDTYKMLRMNEMPEIEIHLLESNDPPTGAGEPGVPALAPVVLNAIFAATGKRIRKLPVLSEDLG